MSAITWEAAIREFGIWQHAGKIAAGTVRLYAYRLVDLAKLEPRGPGLVTEQLLLAILGNPAWAPNTAKNVRSAYSSFFAWAHKKRHIDINPAYDLPPITVPRGLPRPVPEMALRESLRAAPAREEFMMRLGACGGLRAAEIAAVHSDQWERYSRTLTVVGKGGKTRQVVIGDPVLRKLLNDLRGVAFPNRSTGKPMTPGHISVLLSRALVETYTGHTLRHRFATQGLRVTKNLLAVHKALGHSRLDTTQIYTLLDNDDLVELGDATAA